MPRFRLKIDRKVVPGQAFTSPRPRPPPFDRANADAQSIPETGPLAVVMPLCADMMMFDDAAMRTRHGSLCIPVIASHAADAAPSDAALNLAEVPGVPRAFAAAVRPVFGHWRSHWEVAPPPTDGPTSASDRIGPISMPISTYSYKLL